MRSKSPEVRLRDIAENISAIREFTTGLNAPSLAADRKTLYAVVRALEIISEASKRLPDDLKARHSAIDWAAVAAAGNVYRHEYESVDERLIWKTVQDDLGQLEAAVLVELQRHP